MRSVLSAQLSKQHRRMIFDRNHIEVTGTIDGEGTLPCVSVGIAL